MANDEESLFSSWMRSRSQTCNLRSQAGLCQGYIVRPCIKNDKQFFKSFLWCSKIVLRDLWVAPQIWFLSPCTHVYQAEFILSTSSLFFPFFMVNWWKLPCSSLKAYVEITQQWPPRTLSCSHISYLMAWVSLKGMCLVGPLWSLIVE